MGGGGDRNAGARLLHHAGSMAALKLWPAASFDQGRARFREDFGVAQPQADGPDHAR